MRSLLLLASILSPAAFGRMPSSPQRQLWGPFSVLCGPHSLRCGLGSAAVWQKIKKTKEVPLPKFGVKTPGVQIPMADLKSEAALAIDGSADGLLFTDSVLVANRGKNRIDRFDPKTNKPTEPFTGFDKPCGGLVSAFGSVWVPKCGNQTLSRIDPKTGKETATIDVGDRKSTRLNSSHVVTSRMPSSA